MKRIGILLLLFGAVLVAVSCSGTATIEVENWHEKISYQSGWVYPHIQAKVAGETKSIPNGFESAYYSDTWEIDWFGLFKLQEEVTITAWIYDPVLTDPGFFEVKVKVSDEDWETVEVTRCEGAAE
jgi:hypothetical protein